jgi:hypothetical protein
VDRVVLALAADSVPDLDRQDSAAGPAMGEMRRPGVTVLAAREGDSPRRDGDAPRREEGPAMA